MISICVFIYRFLYSDEVQIGPETVMTTLYTAKKYAVPALEAHCVDFLTKHLRADNAFMLLTQVGKFKLSFGLLGKSVFGGKLLNITLQRVCYHTVSFMYGNVLLLCQYFYRLNFLLMWRKGAF